MIFGVRNLRSSNAYEKRKRRDTIRKSKELKADLEQRKTRNLINKDGHNPVNPFNSLYVSTNVKPIFHSFYY